MQHAARLALVLVGPCVHVLRVALRDHGNALAHCALCGAQGAEQLELYPGANGHPTSQQEITVLPLSKIWNQS